MANPVVQVQWSLTSSTEATYNVARGILVAATSDNVQPLAILACERFGNTLAMSQETCNKIEQRVLPTPKPAVVQFLQGLVGYSKNDCASQFGKSQAGVQFLGLAAALLSTTDPFKSSESIALMLRNTAVDTRLLPTTRQLKDMLARLQPRCIQSGFMNDVLAAQKSIREWEIKQGETPERVEYSSWLPDPKGMEMLVDAFRQLCRIGATSVTQISIRTFCCTPWVAAFTQWCLGFAPSIFLDDGRRISQGADSRVIVTILTGATEDSPPGIEVAVHHGFQGPRDLAVSGITGPWEGVSRIDMYGQWLLQNYAFDDVEARECLMQVLPGALHQVLERLHFSRYKHFDHRVPLENWPFEQCKDTRQQIHPDMLNLRLYPLPKVSDLSRMLRIIIGHDTIRVDPFENGLLVADNEKCKVYLKDLAIDCGCTKCAASHRAGAVSNMFKPCECKDFYRRLSIVVADILALSLFNSPNGLYIRLPIPQHLETRNRLKTAVECIITTGKIQVCEFTDLLDWSLALVGHKVTKEVRDLDWIMSCQLGQAVWPTIYDTNIAEKRGFLSLSWLRGDLRYKDEIYKVVQGSDEGSFMLDPTDDIYNEAVTRPCNLVPSLRMKWRIKVGDGVLRASFGVQGMDDRYAPHTVNPVLLLSNLAAALNVEDCPHEAGMELEREDRFCTYTGPINPTQPASESKNKASPKLAVVAIDGADDLRLLTMACPTQPPFVLRKSACLRCCLDVCRRTNFPVLIL
ncbi:MAG: hypothetical protein Q9174_002258 [Haloplaca sp. 1 TL-2023]